MLAVVFDYVFRQRTRICDDNKMTISLTAVSVDDAYLPPLYFKFVELSLSLSLSTRLSDESLSIIHHSVLQRDAADQGHTGMALLGDSGGVVNSLDFCPASPKSLGCFYFRCVLSSQWKAVTVNLRILHCQL